LTSTAQHESLMLKLKPGSAKALHDAPFNGFDSVYDWVAR